MSVSTHLSTLASNLNVADNEATKIQTSINTLDSRLKSYFNTSSIETIRFGSSVRKTMLPRSSDPYSDVDYMIVFDNSSNYKPQTYLSWLKSFAESWYSSSEIYQSSPVVVLSLGHIKFDLVPAYRFWGTIYIPAPSKLVFTDWIQTNPSAFSTEVDNAHKNTNYNLKPAIRLVKYWNARNDYIFESYSLEQSIVRTSFGFQTDLKQLVFRAIEGLSAWNLPQAKRDKVMRAQQIVKDTQSYETNGYTTTAEQEIKKLLPSL